MRAQAVVAIVIIKNGIMLDSWSNVQKIPEIRLAPAMAAARSFRWSFTHVVLTLKSHCRSIDADGHIIVCHIANPTRRHWPIVSYALTMSQDSDLKPVCNTCTFN